MTDVSADDDEPERPAAPEHPAAAVRVYRAARGATRTLAARVAPNVRAFRATDQPKIWMAALLIGVCVSLAAIVFREAIALLQLLWLQDASESVASAARRVPWWAVLGGPIVGGLLVGILLERVVPLRRAGGVADVIEARAMGGRNIAFVPGLASAAVNAISLGFGASSGREGPMVHMGAAISTSLAHSVQLQEWSRRTLLACGVASAVSASFNAPIAGVLFAHEVILGHYAMRSFVPIVISSVSGTILSRQWFGADAAFSIPDYPITSYLEFPAFALLGVLCAVVAVLFQYALVVADTAARSVELPLWLRPVIGGALIGAIALVFPEILGVGYEATDLALKNALPLVLMLALLVAKTVATAITLASRFGGGVFSPSLYLGAMAGGAFGTVAAALFPDLASSQGLYAIIGMGAVAAAVIGAPISTTVIVFELTGGYAITIALLLAVAVSVGINEALNARSFFQYQLESRGLPIREGPHRTVVRRIKVMDFMRPLPTDEQRDLEEDDRTPLLPDASLEAALRRFDETGAERLPVVDPANETRVIAVATQIGALRAHAKALVAVSEEEHR